MQLYQTAIFKSNLRNKISSLLGPRLISLPPVTGLSILSISGKMSINTFSVCSGHKKEKWIHCSSMVYFTTWMTREKAQDCAWSQRYTRPLKREHISKTTHPVVCHSISKIMPEKRKVSRKMRFCCKSSHRNKQTSPRNQQELLWSSPFLVAWSSSREQSFPLATRKVS